MNRTISTETTKKAEQKPPVVQPHQKPKMIFWFILAVLVTLILIGWVVLTYQKTVYEADKLALEQKVLEVKKQAPQDETADWQSYVNQKYGFSFEYPKDWYIDETEEYVELRDSHPSYPIGNIDIPIFSIHITFKPQELQTVDEWFNYKKNNFCDPYFCNYDFKKILFNGFEAGMFTRKIVDSASVSIFKTFEDVAKYKGQDRGYGIGFENEKNIYFIEFISYENSDKYLNHKKIADQILSTFKFLEKNETKVDLILGCMSEDLREKVDQKTLKVFEYSSCYAKDKNNVYIRSACGQDCMWTNIQGADPASFSVIKFPYGKDNRAVYLIDKKTKIDVDTLHILDSFLYDMSYARDKNGFYYAGTKIEQADILTFGVIVCEQAAGCFAKDKNNVYIGGNILKDADPSTFVLLKEKPQYLKDSNHVWYRNGMDEIKIVLGADAETFEAVKFPISNTECYKVYMRDKQYIYEFGKRVEDSDAASYVPEISGSRICPIPEFPK
ncbi:MAG TPA: DKNYY domain-containing protein [bacterium]|nr:DKNYY domain-containing protein [bacterium]